MAVLSELEPKSVYRFFEEMCAIPRGSGKTKAVSDWIVSFARERGLKYRQDAANNVVIFKDATPGYENAPAVMVQGHMDMVCEQDPDCTKNMDTDGLDLFVEGDLVGAHGTTLGGDDGIAVAMGMAILDSEDIPHGPLECVFTVDEEVGLLGAQALDVSDLKARILINLDSEEDGVFTVSSAGSTRLVTSFSGKREPCIDPVYRLTVTGLVGGHSGEEIHKGRANSNLLLGRAMYELGNACALRLIEAAGGAKDNAIPRESSALITLSDPAAAAAAASALDAALKGEYRATDPGVRVLLEPADSELDPLDVDATRRITCFLFCVPNGVQAMSADVPGLVQTSTNLGRLFTKGDTVSMGFMARSCINSQRDETVERIEALALALGGTFPPTSSNSAWEFKADSPLRDVMIAAFRDIYGAEPIVAALHAGLECGVLAGKIPGLDCISIGPDLTDIHTPRERLHVASAERIWKLVLETLKRLK